MKFGKRLITTLLLLALMFSYAPQGSVSSVSAATCYWAQFIADVTIPDGTNFTPGTAFKKTWRLKNIGTCAWNSSDVSLVFDSGEKMGSPASVALSTSVNPGQTVDITVDMTAPSTAGHYFGYWKFKSTAGLPPSWPRCHRQGSHARAAPCDAMKGRLSRCSPCGRSCLSFRRCRPRHKSAPSH